jgi:hypothetical protein
VDIRERFHARTGQALKEKQILLVGSNPLPAALAALALRPCEGVWLVYTPQVADRAERLHRWLDAKGLSVVPVHIRDPHDAHVIRQDLAPLAPHCKEAGISYSGGTKVLAVQAHKFWLGQGGCQAQGSYLSSDGVLWFDAEGASESLRSEPTLALKELCDLHTGLPYHPPTDEHRNSSARRKAADRIATHVGIHGWRAYKARLPRLYADKATVALSSGDLPGELLPVATRPVGAEGNEPSPVTLKCDYQAAAYDTNFANEGVFTRWPVPELCALLGVNGACLDDICSHLRGEPRPERHDDRKGWRLGDAKWLWGEWLEVWLAGVLEDARIEDGGSKPLFHEVHQDLKIKDPKRKPGEDPKRKSGEDERFQADVVAVHGATAYLFTCTVDEKKGLVKSKLFEAVQRAAQLGGDHARVGVFSFTRSPDAIVKEIQQEGWDGYDDVRAFGLDDLAHPDELIRKVREWVLGRPR